MESARELAIRLVDPKFETSTKDWDAMGSMFAEARDMRMRKIKAAEALIEARDAAIRAEERKLPLDMLIKLVSIGYWSEGGKYMAMPEKEVISKIIASYDYSIKEEGK